MNGKNNDIETLPSYEVDVSTVFNAPRNVVFESWVDAKRIEKWWGSAAFTNQVRELDARPGGTIRIDMKSPDGNVYPMKGEFKEIVKHERIVFTSTAIDAEGNAVFDAVNTVAFVEDGGHTVVSIHAEVFNATPEAAPYIAGQEEGWKQSLSKLGDQLGT